MNVITTSENHCLLACDDLQSDRHIIFLRNMRPLSQRQKIFCEMQAELSKSQYKSTKLHGVSFHKSIIFIATNVRTSNLIQQIPVHVSNHGKFFYQ